VTSSVTFSSEDERAGPFGAAPGEPAPYLYTILDCERLHDASSRYSLRHVRAVRIGRAGERSASSSGGQLSIGIPDRRSSREHARFLLREGRWVVEDLGSKNGTFVNGEKTPISGSRIIVPDDTVAFGDVPFRIEKL